MAPQYVRRPKPRFNLPLTSTAAMAFTNQFCNQHGGCVAMKCLLQEHIEIQT